MSVKVLWDYSFSLVASNALLYSRELSTLLLHVKKLFNLIFMASSEQDHARILADSIKISYSLFMHISGTFCAAITWKTTPLSSASFVIGCKGRRRNWPVSCKCKCVRSSGILTHFMVILAKQETSQDLFSHYIHLDSSFLYQEAFFVILVLFLLIPAFLGAQGDGRSSHGTHSRALRASQKNLHFQSQYVLLQVLT